MDLLYPLEISVLEYFQGWGLRIHERISSVVLLKQIFLHFLLSHPATLGTATATADPLVFRPSKFTMTWLPSLETTFPRRPRSSPGTIWRLSWLDTTDHGTMGGWLGWAGHGTMRWALRNGPCAVGSTSTKASWTNWSLPQPWSWISHVHVIRAM